MHTTRVLLLESCCRVTTRIERADASAAIHLGWLKLQSEHAAAL